MYEDSSVDPGLRRDDAIAHEDSSADPGLRRDDVIAHEDPSVDPGLRRDDAITHEDSSVDPGLQWDDDSPCVRRGLRRIQTCGGVTTLRVCGASVDGSQPAAG